MLWVKQYQIWMDIELKQKVCKVQILEDKKRIPDSKVMRDE